MRKSSLMSEKSSIISGRSVLLAYVTFVQLDRSKALETCNPVNVRRAEQFDLFLVL